MQFFLRILCSCLLLGIVVSGCSTPAKRAHQRAAAFQRLSPSDQKLVLGGHVRPGLSQDGVYIAWGEPDSKTVRGTEADAAGEETWVYRQRVTLVEPMNSYDYSGPYHGYDELPLRSWQRPGFGVGGIGNEGLLQYQPHVRHLDTLRLAVFNTGKVGICKPVDGKEVTAHSPRVHAKPASAHTTKVHGKKSTHHRHLHRRHGSHKASGARR